MPALLIPLLKVPCFYARASGSQMAPNTACVPDISATIKSWCGGSTQPRERSVASGPCLEAALLMSATQPVGRLLSQLLRVGNSWCCTSSSIAHPASSSMCSARLSRSRATAPQLASQIYSASSSAVPVAAQRAQSTSTASAMLSGAIKSSAMRPGASAAAAASASRQAAAPAVRMAGVAAGAGAVKPAMAFSAAGLSASQQQRRSLACAAAAAPPAEETFQYQAEVRIGQQGRAGGPGTP